MATLLCMKNNSAKLMMSGKYPKILNTALVPCEESCPEYLSECPGCVTAGQGRQGGVRGEMIFVR